MAERTDSSLLFVVEWFDPMPQMKKKYLLKYFVDQHAAEMIDVKSRRMFLKKSPCPDTMSKDDFYIGSKILLYSRELEIIDYGDGKTREKLHFQVQHVAVILSCSLYQEWGNMIGALNEKMNLVQVKSILPNENDADKICGILGLDSRNNRDFSGGVSLLLILHAENGFDIAKSVATSARVKQGYYASANGQETSSLTELLFSKSAPSTATLDNCTCCIVKPHAFKSRLLGPIIQQIISQGYEISAARSMQFERIQAEEFLEVYKGVLPEYLDMVGQMCLGTSVALELRAENAVETFRETAGPWDVELAQELRPDTIRGKWGKDRIRCVVHCTDLPQDGASECEYVFKLL